MYIQSQSITNITNFKFLQDGQKVEEKSLHFPGFSRAINLLFHRLPQQKVNVTMTFIKGHSWQLATTKIA